MIARRVKIQATGSKTRYLIAAVALFALVAAACSSSSKTVTAPSTTTPSTTSPSAASSGSGDSVAAAVAAAKDAVQKLLVRPTTLIVPPFSAKPPTGKTIDYIACSVPACQEFIPLLKAATDALGWNLKSIQMNGTPQSVADAYEQAVRDKPAGVVGSGGISPDVFPKQLKELKDENVPVVLQAVPGSSLPGLTAVVQSNKETTANGQQMADYMLADSGGHDVHLAIVSTPATPVYAFAHTPLIAAVGPSSCTSCSAVTFNFPVTDLGPSLPSKVVSFLRGHPEVNYVFTDFANETDGIPAALQRAGLADKIKILTIDITSTQVAYMKAGQNLVATAGNPWPEIMWTDAGIIAASTVSAADLTAAESIQLPYMIITKDNVIDSQGQPYFPLVAGYQQIFKTAWKVG